MKQITTIFLLSCAIAFSATAVNGQMPVIRNVFPLDRSCAFVYGSNYENGQDFLVKECEGAPSQIKTFNIGYIKALQFTAGNSGWGLIGGRLVKIKNDGDFLVAPAEFDEKSYWFNDLFFLDKNNGWASADNGVVIRTSDGGISWNTIEIPMAKNLFGIKFHSEKFGWVLDSGSTSETKNTAYFATSRSSEDWTEMFLPDDQVFTALDFGSKEIGCGLSGNNDVYCTTNGKTWIKSPVPNRHREDLIFTGTNRVWIVGDKIERSFDGGQSWYISSIPGQDEEPLGLESIVFLNEKVGWAFGLTRIFKTVDGGDTWIDRSNTLVRLLESN